jgi:hypothetical protein
MPKYSFIVLTNPVAGKEEEYNRWYNQQHLPDILNLPGFVAAQRFRLAETQFAGDGGAHKYLAIYEIETDDLTSTLNELRTRVGTPEIVPSDAIDMENVATFIFTPVANKVMASDVKRPRRVA